MSGLEGAILGMGNPLLDISSEVPIEILEKYDVRLNNAILAEDKHLPLYSELISNYPVQYIAGGATQNSIRVAQWIIKVPGSTAYFGAIGTDSYGETLERCALQDGVRVIYQKNPEVPTGTCAVLINGRERSLIANLGAANTFSPAHLETPDAQDAISKAKLIYISGFFLTVSVESLLILTKRAVEDNKIFALNLAAPFLIQFFADQLAAAIPFTDFVFANESEAATYGEAKGWGNDIEKVALKLAAQPKASGTRPRVVVFTQGSRPTIVASGGVITQYPVDPLPTELIVDTNGAGDAFVGGFIAQLVQGKPISEAVRAGHYASKTIIQRSGCSFPKESDFY